MFDTVESHTEAYMIGAFTHSSYDICNIGHVSCDDDVVCKCSLLAKTIKSTLPPLKTSLLWSYIRGYYDRHGEILENTCYINTHSEEFANNIAAFCKIPNEIYGSRIVFSQTNCVDFLGNMYKYRQKNLYIKEKFQSFVKMLNTDSRININTVKIFKALPNAVMPSKEKYSDVGYDLTIVKKVKEWNSKTTLYDTGIKVSLPIGYYAEVVPRSSLSKSGYMLANSVGIIDPNYTGNLLIALTKVDDVPDIMLPFRCCQLIPRRQVIMDIVKVDVDFDETTRGDNGFGSTGL